MADGDPVVRAAAVGTLEPLAPERRWAIARDLLRDPLRMVLALAAETLAGLPVEAIPASERAAFRRATEDYLASLRQNADDPAAQVNLGNFRAARGEGAEAKRVYREALALDPDWVPGYVNLADLFRQTGRDAKGEMALRQGLARQPEAVALHSVGRKREARTVAEAGLKRVPGYPSLNALRSRLAEEVRKR